MDNLLSICSVEIAQESDRWMIVKLIERKNFIVRRSVNLSKQSHILASNIDQAILMITLDRPITTTAFIDRFLVAANASNIEVMKRRTEKYWNAISSTPQPVIAAVNGFALGGGLELAMMCDLIIVGENAQLGQPEVKIGIMPGAGGTQRITRAVGKFNSMKINLLGKPMSGIEAFNMGLACEVVPDEKVLDTAIKMANTISRMPPLSVQAIKETIINGYNASLETSLLLERKTFQVLLSSNDKKEGMEAFVEKRKPNFKGN